MNTVEYFCAIFCIYIFLQYLHILYDICGQHLDLANEGGFDRKLLVERQFIFTTGWVHIVNFFRRDVSAFHSLKTHIYNCMGGFTTGCFCF